MELAMKLIAALIFAVTPLPGIAADAHLVTKDYAHFTPQEKQDLASYPNSFYKFK